MELTEKDKIKLPILLHFAKKENVEVQNIVKGITYNKLEKEISQLEKGIIDREILGNILDVHFENNYYEYLPKRDINNIIDDVHYELDYFIDNLFNFSFLTNEDKEDIKNDCLYEFREYKYEQEN